MRGIQRTEMVLSVWAKLYWRRVRRLRFAWILAFALLVGNSVGLANADGAPKRVLVVGSYLEEVPFQKGFLEGLAEGLGDGVVLYKEYLSYPSFGGETHEANFKDYLERKYSSVQLDLIVLFDEGAISWAKTYPEFKSDTMRLNLIESWKLASEFDEGDLSNYLVFPELNFVEVLELVERLDPGVSVHVLFDETSEVSRMHRNTIEEAAGELGIKSRMEYLSGDLGEMLQRLSKLPMGSPVVCLPLFSGEGGEPITPGGAVRFLTASLDLKFYTMWDTLMVEGVLGGKMLESRRVGSKAAEQSLLMIEGAPLLGAEVYREELYRYIIDDGLRRKFEIDRSLLPQGTILQNPVPQFLELYFWQSLILVLTVLGLAIATLTLRVIVYRRTRELKERNGELNTALSQRNRLAEVGRGMTMLAHDLRSPACFIKSACSMLGDKDFDLAFSKELVQRMNESSEKTLSMIGDMLDYVQSLELKIESVPARSFVESLELDIGLMSPAGRSIVVECVLKGDCDLMLDTIKMSRVVSNLVKNSIESLEKSETEDGNVIVAVNADPEVIEILVSDNGPGIAKEIAESLFEPFQTSGKTSGVGLGLAITKEFVVAHGGEISCASQPGETVFKIVLPNGAGVNERLSGR